MRRSGAGLPTVLIVTLVISAIAVLAAIRLRDVRNQRMVAAAEDDISAMMDAVDRYHALYSALPGELADLNKVGYHERGGMIVCTFRLNNADGVEPYLDLAIRHRAAQIGAWTEYPATERIIRFIKIPDCSSARR